METRITEMDFDGDLKSIVNQVLIMMAADEIQTVFFRISEFDDPHIKINISTYQMNPGLLISGETEIKSTRAAFSRVLNYSKLKQSFPFIMVIIRKDIIKLAGQKFGRNSWEIEVRFSPVDFPWIMDGVDRGIKRLKKVTDQTVYVQVIDYTK